MDQVFRAVLSTKGRKTGKTHSVMLRAVKYNEKMILNESAPVGFVVLNNNYKGINPKRMQFYKTLGYGKTNHTLFHLVKISFKLIQESRNLPVNYFV